MTQRDHVRIICPTCGRPIAGLFADTGLRLLKHLAPRDRENGRQTWCDASERLIVRTAAGTWKVE